MADRVLIALIFAPIIAFDLYAIWAVYWTIVLKAESARWPKWLP